MYSQYNDQLKNSFKPVSELFELNYKTIEALAKQQSNFFTDVMSQGMAFTQNLAGQTDLQGILQAQKEYGEEFQGKLVAATKEAYAVLTEAQNRATEVVKSGFSQSQEAAAKPASKVKTAK